MLAVLKGEYKGYVTLSDFHINSDNTNWKLMDFSDYKSEALYHRLKGILDLRINMHFIIIIQTIYLLLTKQYFTFK